MLGNTNHVPMRYSTMMGEEIEGETEFSYEKFACEIFTVKGLEMH